MMVRSADLLFIDESENKYLPTMKPSTVSDLPCSYEPASYSQSVTSLSNLPLQDPHLKN